MSGTEAAKKLCGICNKNEVSGSKRVCDVCKDMSNGVAEIIEPKFISKPCKI